mmetsp:Transcript_84023/g.168271  ORF Transcript_84023/g.168271 Transcript_84023/m.168271 type:complete len:305 (+) Transcript_84023:463-1377(+)
MSASITSVLKAPPYRFAISSFTLSQVPCEYSSPRPLKTSMPCCGSQHEAATESWRRSDPIASSAPLLYVATSMSTIKFRVTSFFTALNFSASFAASNDSLLPWVLKSSGSSVPLSQRCTAPPDPVRKVPMKPMGTATGVGAPSSPGVVARAGTSRGRASSSRALAKNELLRASARTAAAAMTLPKVASPIPRRSSTAVSVGSKRSNFPTSSTPAPSVKATTSAAVQPCSVSHSTTSGCSASSPSGTAVVALCSLRAVSASCSSTSTTNARNRSISFSYAGEHMSASRNAMRSGAASIFRSRSTS